MNKHQHVGDIKIYKTNFLIHTQIYIFNVSAILSADNT